MVTEWEGGLRLRLIRPAWRDVTSPDWSTELVALARPGNVPPNFLVPAHSHPRWAGSLARWSHVKTEGLGVQLCWRYLATYMDIYRTRSQ